MSEEQKTSLVTGLGITGLVAGILTFIVSFIPCFGVYALFIGVIALVISIIGLIIAIYKKASKGLLIAALILSLIGVIIAYLQYQGMQNMAKHNYERPF